MIRLFDEAYFAENHLKMIEYLFQEGEFTVKVSYPESDKYIGLNNPKWLTGQDVTEPRFVYAKAWEHRYRQSKDKSKREQIVYFFNRDRVLSATPYRFDGTWGMNIEFETDEISIFFWDTESRLEVLQAFGK